MVFSLHSRPPQPGRAELDRHKETPARRIRRRKGATLVPHPDGSIRRTPHGSEHADLVSGSRELCDRVASAKIYLSHEGDARYGFDYEKVKDGDSFTLGNTIVIARHTPGHTPEHIS
ncbi:MAG: hypothetical protein WBL39_15935, partial [Terrimicrobiaceae bacterium]